MSAERSTPLIGRIAVQMKLVTAEQLAELTRAQSKDGDTTNLGELMMQRGLIDRAQLVRLLETQKQVLTKARARQAVATADAEPEVPAPKGPVRSPNMAHTLPPSARPAPPPPAAAPAPQLHLRPRLRPQRRLPRLHRARPLPPLPRRPLPPLPRRPPRPPARPPPRRIPPRLPRRSLRSRPRTRPPPPGSTSCCARASTAARATSTSTRAFRCASGCTAASSPGTRARCRASRPRR